MGCATSRIHALAHETGVGNAKLGTFFDEYVLDRKLSNGAFSSVYAARSADGDGGAMYAVKVVDIRHAAARRSALRREAAVMEKFSMCNNVVRFHALVGMEGLSCMVMEFCDQSLLTHLEGTTCLTESTFKPLFADMLTALAVVHAACLVHRDVSPDNFLASTSSTGGGVTLKLKDFSCAARVSSPHANELTSVHGTAPFMAPEMLQGRLYGTKVDTWSFGVLAYVLTLGRWPYMPTEPSIGAVHKAIREGIPEPNFQSAGGEAYLSQNLVLLLQGLLQRLTCVRYSASAALEHPWFHEPSFAREEDEVLLRPMLRAARHVGAFKWTTDATAQTDVDTLLSKAQAARNVRLLRARSDLSTEAGSESASGFDSPAVH